MYGELLIVLNSVYNYILLLVCSRLAEERVIYSRFILCSVFSSIASFFIEPTALALLVSFVILLLAFPKTKFLLRKVIYLLLATFLLGGMLTAFQAYATSTALYYLVTITICFIFVFFIILILQRMHLKLLMNKLCVPCELQIKKQTFTCKGFIDTGNQSLEQLSQRPVHFASIDVLQSWHEVYEGIQKWDIERPHDFSMLPQYLHDELAPIFVHTIATKELVLAFKCSLVLDDLTLDRQYVVFTRQPLQFHQHIDVVLNAAVCKHLKI